MGSRLPWGVAVLPSRPKGWERRWKRCSSTDWLRLPLIGSRKGATTWTDLLGMLQSNMLSWIHVIMDKISGSGNLF